MARRRFLTGAPLLVAGTGVAVSIACGGGSSFDSYPMGNLMAPPMVRLCVDTVPEGAAVIMDGVPVSYRCTEVYSFHEVSVEVSAPGYVPASETVTTDGGGEITVSISLDSID